ncbi:MAG TPA: hypothetical protein VFV98_04585 [Vicinamibacterales bacterium]|nr:hypothetical protein [Vicinamibacterales bacterium]
MSTRRRLDAWKEIASYLNRDVTTVRRWEKREGLPVHRHLHGKLGSIYAYSDEIDAWSERRSVAAAPAVPRSAADAIAPAATVAPAAPGQRFWRAGVSAALVTAIVVATASGPSVPRAHPSPDVTPRSRFAVPAPPGTLVETLTLSPDGEQAAFVAVDAGGPQLWIRQFDSTDAQRIPGTEGASFPFWSPDGRQLGFFAEGRLKSLGIATRDVRDLAAAADGRGGAWSDRGEIIFAPSRDTALFRVSTDGGPVTAVTTIDQRFVGGHAWPEFLPDGRHFLFTDYTVDPKRFGIYVGDLATGDTRRLLAKYSSASYSREGLLLYSDTGLVAQRFDAGGLEVSGPVLTIADRVRHRYGMAHKAEFSLSATGLLAVRGGTEDTNRLVWLDRSGGEPIAIFSDGAWHSNPTLAPDGASFLATISSGRGQDSLWRFDVATGEKVRVTLAGAIDVAPVWSPRGDSVLFASIRNRHMQVFERSFATGAETLARRAASTQVPESWSRDGQYLTFSMMTPGSKHGVWARRLDADAAPFVIADTAANEGQSQLSPNGRYVAYTSDESGQFEIYVQSFPDPTQRWQLSEGGGADPRWRSDGRELYYLASDRRLMAVDVHSQPSFRRGRVRALFDSHLEDLWQDTRNHYDVTPTGDRFVFLQPSVDRRAAPYVLMFNWLHMR